MKKTSSEKKNNNNKNAHLLLKNFLTEVEMTCLENVLFFYISKGLSVGLRMCLMLAPGWEGLKGAWAP